MSSFCNHGKPNVLSSNITFSRMNQQLLLVLRHTLGVLLRPYYGQTIVTDQDLVWVSGWHGRTPCADSITGDTDIGTLAMPAIGRASDSLSIIYAPQAAVSAFAETLREDSLRAFEALPEGSQWVPGTNGRRKPRGCSPQLGHLHFHLDDSNPQKDIFELGIFLAHALASEVSSYRESTLVKAVHNRHHKLKKMQFSLEGVGAAYGVMQRELPLMHVDFHTGIVEQVRANGGVLRAYTSLLSPAQRLAILQGQRQEFLGAEPVRAAAIVADAAQAPMDGSSDEDHDVGGAGGEGGGDDAAGEAPMGVLSGSRARSGSRVSDTGPVSVKVLRGRSARIAGAAANSDMDEGVASRVSRRRSLDLTDTAPKRARRVIIHQPSDGSAVMGRLSPDFRGGGFVPLGSDSDEDVCVYTHSVADCFARALAREDDICNSDLDELLSTSDGEWESS